MAGDIVFFGVDVEGGAGVGGGDGVRGALREGEAVGAGEGLLLGGHPFKGAMEDEACFAVGVVEVEHFGVDAVDLFNEGNMHLACLGYGGGFTSFVFASDTMEVGKEGAFGVV